MALARAPSGVSTNSQLRRPTVKGRMAFSAAALLMFSRPSSHDCMDAGGSTRGHKSNAGAVALKSQHDALDALTTGIKRNPVNWVLGFQREHDAKVFLSELGIRLGQFGLSLHEDKTRLIRFGRFAKVDLKKGGGAGKAGDVYVSWIYSYLRY